MTRLYPNKYFSARKFSCWAREWRQGRDGGGGNQQVPLSGSIAERAQMLADVVVDRSRSPVLTDQIVRQKKVWRRAFKSFPRLDEVVYKS
jgi:hypothetical protein